MKDRIIALGRNKESTLSNTTIVCQSLKKFRFFLAEFRHPRFTFVEHPFADGKDGGINTKVEGKTPKF
jgi:hypothetical protein